MKKTMTSAAATCVLVLGLSACGNSGDDVKKTAGSAKSAAASATSSSAGSSSAAASDSASSGASAPGDSSTSSNASGAASSDAAAQTPSGTRDVTAPASGIAFAVPEKWQRIDARAVDDPKVRERLEPLAKKSGVDVDTYIKSFTQRADLVAIDASGSSQFADNVNAIKSPVKDLPSESAITEQLGTISAHPVAFAKVSTPLGEAAQEEYTLTMGAQTVHGVMMFVPNAHDGLTVLTFSGSDSASVQKYAKDAAASLHKS